MALKNNFIILGGIAMLAMAVSACKDKSAFEISGKIEHPGDIKKIYLLEADSTKINMVDSTNLSEDGKFKFKRVAPYANLYKIRIGGSIFDIIAQNGEDIDFKTDVGDSTRAYSISGSDESGKIKDFNKLSNVYADKSSKLVAEYQNKAEALGHESDSLVSIYMPRFQQIQADYGDAVLKFVNDNKESLAGFYAMTSLDQYRYEQQLVNYADGLKDKFKDNPGVRQFVKQMMEIKPVSVGHKAPEFTAMGLDGKPVKLSDYKGKYVMLDFWASWCGPCRQENPNVVKQYAIYKDKGLNILGISLDEEKSAWQKAINDDKLTWQHASDLQKFDGPTERLYHIEAIPSNFIIDPQGMIVAKNVTGPALEEFLNKTFNKAQ